MSIQSIPYLARCLSFLPADSRSAAAGVNSEWRDAARAIQGAAAVSLAITEEMTQEARRKNRLQFALTQIFSEACLRSLLPN